MILVNYIIAFEESLWIFTYALLIRCFGNNPRIQQVKTV